MTNEQAIKELQESYDIMRNHDIDESESYLMQALNMAIKALQTQADGDLISKGKMLMFLNDMRFGIAPDETVADDDERREREAQVDVLDDLMEVVEQMPGVAIPSAYKGMTNGEVYTSIFPKTKVVYIKISDQYEVYFDDKHPTCYQLYPGKWWNSPYDPQESEVTDE